MSANHCRSVHADSTTEKTGESRTTEKKCIVDSIRHYLALLRLLISLNYRLVYIQRVDVLTKDRNVCRKQLQLLVVHKHFYRTKTKKTTGFMFNPKDHHSSANTLLELVRHTPGKQHEMSLLARKFAERNLGLDTLVGKYERLLCRASSTNSGSNIGGLPLNFWLHITCAAPRQ